MSEHPEIPDVFPASSLVFELFDHLPNACFYAKDQEHRYIGMNRANLENVFGLASLDQILGKTDYDFQPPMLAEAYHEEDRRVITGRSKIANQVWLVPHVSGTPKWYVSTKVPLINDADEVCGIAGVMYPIATPEDQAAYFRELRPIIQHMEEHFAEDLKMSEMAALAGLSTTQFNFRFRSLLRMSPSDYLLQLRIDAAKQQLTQTQKPLTEIGAAVGFYDQSHFTKRFRKSTGMTPKDYRKRFRP